MELTEKQSAYAARQVFGDNPGNTAHDMRSRREVAIATIDAIRREIQAIDQALTGLPIMPWYGEAKAKTAEP